MSKSNKSMMISNNEIERDQDKYRKLVCHTLEDADRPKNHVDPDKCDLFNIQWSPSYQEEIAEITASLNIPLYFKRMNKYAKSETIKEIQEMMLRLLLYPDRKLEFNIKMRGCRRLGDRLKILERYKVIKFYIGHGSLRSESRNSLITLHPEFDIGRWREVPDD